MNRKEQSVLKPFAAVETKLALHLERMVAVGAVSVDREMLVEARDAGDAQALHHSEAGAIDDREVLVGKDLADSPGRVEVNWQDGLDRDQAAADLRPEVLGAVMATTVAHKSPRLDEHVIGAHKLVGVGKHLGCTNVVLVVGISGRVERRCVYEEAQRSRSWPVVRRCSRQSDLPLLAPSWPVTIAEWSFPTSLRRHSLIVIPPSLARRAARDGSQGHQSREGRETERILRGLQKLKTSQVLAQETP